MSTIGSTLNSITGSLLSEINPYPAQVRKNPTDTTAGTATKTDKVDFSEVSLLFSELKDLQKSDPAEFKQVLTDGASQLRAAASQTKDTHQARLLNNLADKFQTAANSGNLAGLGQNGDSSQNAASGLYAPAQHHHHHSGGVRAARSEGDPAVSAVPNTQ